MNCSPPRETGAGFLLIWLAIGGVGCELRIDAGN